MKLLTIGLVKGQKQEFKFLGWKDDGLAFYATNAEGQPAMIEPVIAYTFDEGSGEPYRFPRVVPLEITPLECRYDILWSQHHHEVLRRWRETKMAEVDALTVEGLSGADCIRVSLDEIQGRKGSDSGIEGIRRREKDEIETHYKKLVNTPLLELFHPFLNAGLLDPFLQGRWADEMGEDFREMSRAANLVLSWCDAEGGYPDYQQFKFALQNVKYVMRGQDGSEYPLIDAQMHTPTDQEAQAYVRMKQLLEGDTLLKQIDASTNRAAATLSAAGENLTKAGQQARADVEAGAATLGAVNEDLAETLGKVSEPLADPLVEAARDASIKRGVPDLFAWWVFQKWHSDKFPTVNAAFKRSGLRPKLEQAGLACSHASFGRWLKIIRDELYERKLIEKRSSGRTSVKAPDFDVEQVADTGLRPGDADEPPEAFVNWVEKRDAAGSMPTEQDVLAYVGDHAGDFALASYTEDELRKIAARWLKAAVKILDSAPTGRLETNEEDSPSDCSSIS